jgi:glycosyltransferase involved in cell wall biosynthesis
MQVTYFHRKPRPNANFSIELVFNNVRRDLAGRVDAQVCVAPCFSNGLVRRLWIMWDARRRQGEINHVTGDTNFTALWLDGRRTVLTNHDCGFVTRKRGLRRAVLKKFWLDWPVRHVAAVTTVSSQIKREIVDFTGCDPAKVHVIPNAASPAFAPTPLEFNEARPRVLHLGTAPNKNLPRLIAAVAGWRCVLVIVGRIERDELRLLRDSGVDYENYVDLTTPQLVAQYEACDIVSFASLYEGFGVPIVEAQAVGRPLVTSNRAPMDEVAGAGACLVDPEDAGAIRAALAKIAGDAAYRRHLVAAGFENVKRFSPERIADMYYRVYEQVLAASACATGGTPTAHVRERFSTGDAPAAR